jgi:ribokinase
MKILVFGSLNLDFVYQVDHFVQPGETLSSSSMRIHCGGKGLNQSIALGRTDCEVYHAGRIGPDGGSLLDMLKSSGVDIRFIETVEIPTGNAVIQVDKHGQNGILLHGGANRTVDRAHVDRVLDGFENGDLLVLQNEISEISYLMECATARGMRICLNPSPADEGIFMYPLDQVRYLILNEIEGERLTGESVPDRIVDALLQYSADIQVVLTLGQNGVLYGDHDRKLRHGIFDVEAVDTTAAGDTFTGFFLGAVVRGLPTESCLLYATAAAALCVSRAGAADSIPTWVETEHFLRDLP